MSGRSRRKKLQRAKRISQADSFASPSLESSGTTNSPFPFPSSDTITSLSTNEADLEDITSSKSEEKLERTTTSTELATSNKETAEKETEGNKNNNNNRKPKKTTSILKTKIIHDGKEHEGNGNRNNKKKVKWTKPKLDGREYEGNEFKDKENIITEVKTMVHESKKRIRIYDRYKYTS